MSERAHILISFIFIAIISIFQDSCIKNEWLSGKAGQVIHLLYESDVVDEDSLVEWYEDLKENESILAEQTTVIKFFEWLLEASEESEESD